jgi:hypothetical protein
MVNRCKKSCSSENMEKRLYPYDKRKKSRKNEKITAFLITQSIVSNYEAGKYGKEWNLDSMMDRWTWFFNEINELFDIDVSDALKTKEPIIV